MAPPPPPLPEELVEGILLRVPPDEPACLFRASLVCKPWCRLISRPGFRRRYREFHRTPPLLGFLCDVLGGEADTARFVPTSAFRSPPSDFRRCRAVDARHGRVLLRCRGNGKASSENVLVVWDPISDERRELPMPMPTGLVVHGCRRDWNAAVLCAADGLCDHLDCHRGPFLVVFVEPHSPYEVSIFTYSSDSGTWSYRIFPHQLRHPARFRFVPCAHVGNALYFRLEKMSSTALKYDLCLREMSAIQLPPTYSCWQTLVLTSREDGGLGWVTVHEFKLCVWSRKDSPQVDVGWTQNRVIDIEMLLRSNDILTSPEVIGFTGGMGVVFLSALGVLFSVDLKTRNLNKVSKGTILDRVVLTYMGFCTPALGAACRDEGSSAVGSNA